MSTPAPKDALSDAERIAAKNELALAFAALCRAMEAEHRAKQAEEAVAVREAAA